MDDLVTWLLEQAAEGEREASEAVERTTSSNSRVDVLSFLAPLYAARPGYRESWRP